ncbi:hypothetical protein IWQ60_008936 [Tieghemiomyces parasiticus]|uniref:C2 domain-containing protein n=1 Tax=Tieghemiomyces parasiticus TaxID=78921 RepID=A0A9W7ZVU4_9FUNG|nr:hypothetical protein IWQ60_008936 [Tieghemiomyces parasiticus]
MPCILKIRVHSARNLPVMDRKTELTDAYVELRLADLEVQRTAICRQTLNPVWNEDFRLEVIHDTALQDEPLELRVLDYDAITADDVIGTVMLDLNPLLTARTVSAMAAPTTTTAETDCSSSLATAPVNAPTTTAASVGDLPAATLPSYAGWFPVTHSLLGIRGEIRVQVRLQFLGDTNPFKDSSAGVPLFSAPHIPEHWVIREVLGFVDALLVADDPEYHWRNSFRTSRASNDARQRTFYRLAGQLRRLTAKKALNKGGDAVIAYRQTFDIEPEEHLITARAIGTVVKLEPRATGHHEGSLMSCASSRTSRRSDTRSSGSSGSETAEDDLELGHESTNATSSESSSDTDAAESGGDYGYRRHRRQQRRPQRRSRRRNSLRSTRSGGSSPTPHRTPRGWRPRSRTSVDSLGRHSTRTAPRRPRTLRYHGHTATDYNTDATGPGEIQSWRQDLFTLHDFPAGSILRIGGVVSARSVKLSDDDSEAVREAWWDELRAEIKAHARSLHCPHVIGYTESVVLTEDKVCILSALGTAAVLNIAGVMNAPRVGSLVPRRSGHSRRFSSSSSASFSSSSSSSASSSSSSLSSLAASSAALPVSALSLTSAESTGSESDVSDATDGIVRRVGHIRPSPCGLCHLPAAPTTTTRPSTTTSASAARRGAATTSAATTTTGTSPSHHLCSCCERRSVPDLLLSTTEVPPELEIVDLGCLIEAHVCRPSRLEGADEAAAAISDALPFVEYDLHRQLVYKLKVLGMNAIFNLQFTLAIGEEWIVALATGTAFYVAALPTPPPLRISRNIDVVDEEDRRFLAIQGKITALSAANRERLDAAFRAQMLMSRRRSVPPPQPPRRRPSRRDRQGDRRRRRHRSRADTGEVNNGGDGNGSGGSGSDESDTSRVRTTSTVTKPRIDLAVQIDDDEDEDLMAALLDVQFPPSFQLLNTGFTTCFRPRAVQPLTSDANGDSTLAASNSASPRIPANLAEVVAAAHGHLRSDGLAVQNVTLFERFALPADTRHPSRKLASVFSRLHEALYYRFHRGAAWAIVAGVQYALDIGDDNQVRVLLHATALTCAAPVPRYYPLETATTATATTVTTPNGTAVAAGSAALHEHHVVTSDATAAMANPHDSPVTGWRPRGFDRLWSPPKAPTPGDPSAAPHRHHLLPSSRTEVPRPPATKARPSTVLSQFTLPSSFAAPRYLASLTPKARPAATTTSTPPSTSPWLSPNGTGPDSRSPSLRPLGTGTAATATATNANIPLGQAVTISVLSELPGAPVASHLGRIALHFVRETSNVQGKPQRPALGNLGVLVHRFFQEWPTNLREHAGGVLGRANHQGHGASPSSWPWSPSSSSSSSPHLGGLNGFVHRFLEEVDLAIRAHVAALGGTGLRSLSVDQFFVEEAGPNQAYALLCLSGDVVQCVPPGHPGPSRSLVTDSHVVDTLPAVQTDMSVGQRSPPLAV